MTVVASIYEDLTERLARNEWQAHEKLPSVRSLAVEYNVHRLTAFKALTMLKEDGHVYVKEKAGFFRNGAAPFYPLNEQLHLADIHAYGAKYDFSRAVIDPQLLPNRYMSELVQETIARHPRLIGTYSTLLGDESLRLALADYFQRVHNIVATPEQIMVTSGSQQALDIIARTFVRRGDYVLIDSPTYSGAADVFRDYGATLIPLERTIDGFSLADVHAAIERYRPTILFTNPTFHNPTGFVMSVNQRKQLLEWSEQYDFYIVEDEAFFDVYFAAEPPQPIARYDSDNRVIYVRGFAKYMAPGLRIGAIVCPEPLLLALKRTKAKSDSGAPLLTQKAFIPLLQSARIEQHFAKLRTALTLRRDALVNELDRNLFTWHTPTGGLSLWLQLRVPLDVDELLRTALDHSIAFIPGRVCDPLLRDIPALRLCFSYQAEPLLRDGVQQLQQLVRRFI